MTDRHEERAEQLYYEIRHTPPGLQDMLQTLRAKIAYIETVLRAVEAEALERAATIADAHDEAPAPGTIDTGAIWRGASARMIAAAIRALKPETGEGR